MASRRSHAPTNASRLSMSCGFRGAGPISWNPLQAAKQRSCGYNMIPHPYRSPKGDWHIHYDVEDDSRSRFAEPREGEVMLIPQLRCFAACSGFLIVTCPLGTRRWLVAQESPTDYADLHGWGCEGCWLRIYLIILMLEYINGVASVKSDESVIRFLYISTA